MQLELALDELLAGEAMGVETAAGALLPAAALVAALPPAQGQRWHVCWQKLAIHGSPHLPQAACSRLGGARTSACGTGMCA